MSDPSAPPSSPPVAASGAVARRSSPHAALAFLVHSPATVANDLPPAVDNQPLCRQKRRRTSKEDEEILKAEYLKNPKPDKASRMEIVSKVALGEKEVQIWFQNKRQNDRRRSRPLDSSSSTLSSELSSMSSDPVTEEECNARENEKELVEAPTEDGLQLTEPVTTVDVGIEAEEEGKPREATEATATEEDAPKPTKPATTESQTTSESILVASTDPYTAETAPTELSSSQQTIPSSQDASQNARNSWISNRRSASFRMSDDYVQESITFPNASAPTTEQTRETTRSLKRAHSFVRLSMTDDGTARVITDADKTPSPPHAKTNPNTFSRAAAGLRRSYSAAGLNERLTAASSSEPSPKLPRTTSNIGRSRDSRAWEFWCDPDTRNSRSLTTRADQEGSGSAADAIGLLRANRKVLRQNQTRQNTAVLSRQGSGKVLGDSGNSIKKSRGPMQRASTTYGRLQSKDAKCKKTCDGSESDELPQTESDKENWEPDLPKQQRPRPHASTQASQRPRQILGENTEIMSQSSSLGAMLAREHRKGSSSGESSDPEQEEELRVFMSSSGTGVSSAEEAGCVEGLLKLSQGNWR